MEKERGGVSISAKAFFASFFILFALMVASGVLTRVIPSGRFDRRGSGAEATVLADSYHE